jgi:hypothetical protein
MEQNNNNNVHMDAEAFENLRQQLAAAQAAIVNLQQQLAATQEENAYLREQHEEDVEDSTDNQERLNRLERENDEFHRLFEHSRAQIARLQRMAPAQLRRHIIILGLEVIHWHQQLHQCREFYMNQIAQEQQQQAEQLQAVQEQHLIAVAAANVEINRLRAVVHEHEREGRLRRLREVGSIVAEMIRLRLARENVQG